MTDWAIAVGMGLFIVWELRNGRFGLFWQALTGKVTLLPKIQP